VGIATVFTLARFSESFLLLRAQAAGLPVVLVPMVLVAMNLVYATAAYPAGVHRRSYRFINHVASWSIKQGELHEHHLGISRKIALQASNDLRKNGSPPVRNLRSRPHSKNCRNQHQDRHLASKRRGQRVHIDATCRSRKFGQVETVQSIFQRPIGDTWQTSQQTRMILTIPALDRRPSNDQAWNASDPGAGHWRCR
jgi:hypothetical protein